MILLLAAFKIGQTYIPFENKVLQRQFAKDLTFGNGRKPQKWSDKNSTFCKRFRRIPFLKNHWIF